MLNEEISLVENLIVNAGQFDSYEDSPWEHPCLTEAYLKRFNTYSKEVWGVAAAARETGPLHFGFSNNLAHNMYKFACMVSERGHEATVFPDAQDTSALSAPEWEEFDGEWLNIFDGKEFLQQVKPDLPVKVERVDLGFPDIEQFRKGGADSDRDALLGLLHRYPSVRFTELTTLPAMNALAKAACAHSECDAIIAASSALSAYFSGKPYLAMWIGGDLDIDCGRCSSYGQMMRLAYGVAKFLLIALGPGMGNCRRLGLRNGIYFPYPMDTDRYSPGLGLAREEWVASSGASVFIFCASRIDASVKGNSENLLEVLSNILEAHPHVAFVFTKWGNDAEEFQDHVSRLPNSNRFLILKPVGKRKLIDYYRSCDLVLDHFVYGCFGVTAMEAAAIGKPVVMRLDQKFFRPFYDNEEVPVNNAGSVEEIYEQLDRLIRNKKFRLERGEAMREWVTKWHGKERVIPILIDLLTFAARSGRVPEDLISPLCDPLTAEEDAYHLSKMRSVEIQEEDGSSKLLKVLSKFIKPKA